MCHSNTSSWLGCQMYSCQAGFISDCAGGTASSRHFGISTRMTHLIHSSTSSLKLERRSNSQSVNYQDREAAGSTVRALKR
jgi:hypothetical protein